MKLFVAAALCLIGLSSTAAGLSPPSDVNIAQTAAYKWSTGQVKVLWDAPSGYSVAQYVVQVDPLDYAFPLNALQDEDSLATYSFRFLPGQAMNALTYGTTGIAINYSENCGWPLGSGRGCLPLLLRKIPEGAAIELPGCDCKPVNNCMCGAAVFNAGRNSPLFIWMIVSNSTGTFARLQTSVSVTELEVASHQSTTSSPIALNSSQLRVEPGSTQAIPFIVRVRNNASLPWENVTTSIPVSVSLLDAYFPGDLWFGVTGGMPTITANGSGNATFVSMTITQPLPTSQVRDLYGYTDVCLSTPTVQSRSTTTTSRSATFTGLAANFPYTATVWAIDQASGNMSDASAPIPGIYFWARNMPPEASKLSLWLQSRWLGSGGLTEWRDASGNGHHLKQTGASSLRPVVNRYSSQNVITNDFIIPGFVRFTRGNGQHMIGGSDYLDLGVSGPMTFYIASRNRQSTLQVIAGRGSISNNFDTSYGWVAGISSTLIDNNDGFFGIKVTDNNGTQAGGSVRNVRTPTHGYQVVTLLSAMISETGSSIPLERYDIDACRDTACNSVIPNFDTALNNTFGDEVSVQYTGPDEFGEYTATPPITNDLAFHIGAPATNPTNPAYAYDGDIYEIMMYRESHTSQQRAAVSQWVLNNLEQNFCPLDITSPGLSSQASQCKTGPVWADCYQTCASGFREFLGSTLYHSCTNGTWNNPPLVCRRRCNDVMAPIYTATCTRRWIEDSFDANVEPHAMTKYVTHPNIPIYMRLRIWDWDTANQYMSVSTLVNDACDRVPDRASILGLHSTRWSTFVPPANNLRLTATVSISLDTPTSVAGVITRLIDQNQHYRVEVSVAGGVQLVRVFSGIRTVIGTSNNVTIATNTWYQVSVSAILRTIQASINGITVLTVVEGGTFATFGAGGMYIGPRSAAKMDNFTLESDCDLGMVARYMYDGMKILFACKPGYTVIGNTTFTCSGTSYGPVSLTCLSKPPTPVPANFSVLERTPNNTFIGTVMAIPANSEQVISYSLMSQWPPGPASAFTVSGCSGAIRVNDPTQLVYQDNPVIILTIFAWPDSQTIAGTAFNVTINLINVPDAPTLEDAEFSVDEGYVGPVNMTWDYTNIDGFPLRWQIIGGTTPPSFYIDPNNGSLWTLPPGLPWSQNAFMSFQVRVSAPDIPSETPLESIATATVLINNMNSVPIFRNEIFMPKEDIAVSGAYIGMVQAEDPDSADPDCPPNWATLNYTIVQNAAWRADPEVFSIDTDGSLFFAATLEFDPVRDYTLFNNRKARKVFVITVQVCDNGVPSLCANATMSIAVLSTNDTVLLSLITGLNLPSMVTSGQEQITFTGVDFPAGAGMAVFYGSPALGVNYEATNCRILNGYTATCRTAAGYGAQLSITVLMAGSFINSTVPLVLSYAAPTLSAVQVVNSAGFTTAGSADGAIKLLGTNFGPPGTPVSIKVGVNQQFSMVVAGGNNYNAYVTHTTIVATALAGCGTMLPVEILVGNQWSTPATQAQDLTSISYPAPQLDSVTVLNGGNISRLTTLGNQRLQLVGNNFGPMSNGAVPINPTFTLTDSTGIFTYTLSCTKEVATSHTRAQCTTPAGVGSAFTVTLGVCAQNSVSYQPGISYNPPIIRDVIGPGANRGSTEGFQLVKITGEEFGPVNSVNSDPQAISLVSYGPPPDIMRYQGASCYVSIASVSGSEITCMTSPGTGAGHWWQIVIGGQSSNILPRNSSYGAPIVSFFTGPGASAADTRAGPAYNVTINGFNFGFDMTLVDITYFTQLTVRRSTDGMLPSTPGESAGIIRFLPNQCSFVQPHRVITCTPPPGAGAAFTWRVIVDDQQSTAPTTSYGPPEINGISITSGRATVTTDGGDMVLLQGSNFGLPYLIQTIMFGPTATENIVTNYSYVDHTALYATIGAGIGTDLRFSVTIADQTSPASSVSISYALPTIWSLTPSTGPTAADAARPTIVTVSGIEFGLLNPDVEVEVAFGNPSDRTLSRLPVVARVPTLAQLTSQTWTKPRAPMNQSVSFLLPAGAGAMRAVRVIPYWRRSPLSDADLSSVALQGGVSAFFSYQSPQVNLVFVYKPSPAETPIIEQLFPNMDPAFLAQSTRRLEIVGMNFAPNAMETGDLITRLVEISTLNGSIYTWSTDNVAVLAANWTSQRLVAYTTLEAGVLRVALGSASFDASQTLWQYSQPYTFSDLSPEISRIVSSPDYPTAGGPGNTLTVFSSGLGGTAMLNVTVDTGPRMRQCRLLSGVGGSYIDNFQQAVTMLASQSGNILQNDFVYQIVCEVPEGEGKNVPVLVWRNGLPSGTGSIGANLITYRSPTVASVGVWSAANSQFSMQNYPVPAAGITSPTINGRARFTGTNFGVCPSIKITLSTDTSLDFVYIDACIKDFDINGNPILVKNPLVQASHTEIIFTVPEGEGTGTQYSALGWFMQLGAGDGVHRNEMDGIILLRYGVPEIDSISPAQLSTAGGQTLLLQGSNFGYLSTPTVFLGSAQRTGLQCFNPVRLSHFNITCTSPAGTGLNLMARVMVAGQTGTGGSATYNQPIISRMRGETLINGSVVNATDWITPGPNNVLTGEPTGETRITLQGFNFGPLQASDNCVFVSLAPSSWGSQTLVCNGFEDFLGEGEVPASYVLNYNDTYIRFILPPGVGTRMITLRAGTQPPSAASNYQNFMYRAPVVTAPLRAVGKLPTDGGGKVQIIGKHFAYRTLNAMNTSTSIAFPHQLPILPQTMFPTENLLINFGLPTSFIPCISTAYTPNGGIPSGFSKCLQNGVLNIAAGISSAPADVITFVVPPGVGVNKSVSLAYYREGAVVVQSNAANFSYDPPEITGIYPDLVLDRGQGNVAIYVQGENFGRFQDLPYMSEEEKIIRVVLNGVECVDPQRVVRNNVNQVQCRTPPLMAAGFTNVTIYIAGQVGSIGWTSEATLLVGCQQDYFAHMGEVCVECPLGASCIGFVQDESLSVNFTGTPPPPGPYSVNIDAGPVMVGDVQVYRRGYHTYPVPEPGFFNLNGTMGPACPELVQSTFPGRAVCIVGCMPKEACVGANRCSDPYQSKPPYFRCADCAKGYYRRAGECIKCPDAPAMLFVGFGVVLLAVVVVGYLLNKYEFDIRLTSIGVDYFQVLAIFANSKVKWPPEIKELYRILSAFNLDIEIVAPECLVPDVSFSQKFGFILSLPFVMIAFFAVISAIRICITRFVFKQRRLKQQLRAMASSISIVLLLLFVFYLYVTKTVLSVWECLPTDPDDGKLYLQVVFEECGKPGGVQQQLAPWAVVGVVFIVIGYPLLLITMLLRNRLTVMEDQVLRAMEMIPPKDSDVSLLRSTMGRTYYQFKPDFAPFWIMVILTRKFVIAFSSLMFSKNSAFQMSMCLLVLFVAFVLQTRYRPYMPRSEFSAVLQYIAKQSEDSPFYNRIKVRVMEVEMRSKKRTANNSMNAVGRKRKVQGAIADWLRNFNTIEAVLLFDAAMVCLLGVLYEAVRPSDVYYYSSRSGITAFLLALIIFGILYFVVVFCGDILQQYQQRRADRALAKAKRKGTISLEMQARSGGNRRSSTFDSFRRDKDAMEATQSTNPMFIKNDGTVDITGSLNETVSEMAEPPPAALWGVIRDNYTSMTTQITALTQELNDIRLEAQKFREKVDIESPSPGFSTSPHGVKENPMSSARRLRVQPSRRVFEPVKRGEDKPADENVIAALSDYARFTAQNTRQSPK